MPYIGVNVSDFDRSLAFYQALGYTEVKQLPIMGTLEEARAYGLDEPFVIKGADIAIDPDGIFLELVGQIAPREPQPQPPGCPPLEIKMPRALTGAL